MPRPTLVEDKRLVERHASLSTIHRRGFRWFDETYRPALERLERSKQLALRRVAAFGWHRVGDLHELHGAPRAAVRAFLRSLRIDAEDPDGWHALGAAYAAAGSYRRARYAILRGLSLAPDDELMQSDLDGVELAMLHEMPGVYDSDDPVWHAQEHLAAGRLDEALQKLRRRRSARARQVLARVHAARGDQRGVLRQWEGVARGGAKVRLEHADWFYVFNGPPGNDPDLWRLMLWKVRHRIEGGAVSFSSTLAELEVPEAKRFELLARCELARCERDVPALLALAGRYPTWREPGEAVLRIV